MCEKRLLCKDITDVQNSTDNFRKRCKPLMYKNLFESFIKVWRCVVHTINSITPATEVQVTKNVLQNRISEQLMVSPALNLHKNPIWTHRTDNITTSLGNGSLKK